jgi:hypothetical protein
MPAHRQVTKPPTCAALICRFSRASNAPGLGFSPAKRAERTYDDRAGHRRAEALTVHIADNDPQAATGLLKHLVEITTHFLRRQVTDTFID